MFKGGANDLCKRITVSGNEETLVLPEGIGYMKFRMKDGKAAVYSTLQFDGTDFTDRSHQFWYKPNNDAARNYRLSCAITDTLFKGEIEIPAKIYVDGNWINVTDVRNTETDKPCKPFVLTGLVV